jgi:hypothetical protein
MKRLMGVLPLVVALAAPGASVQGQDAVVGGVAGLSSSTDEAQAREATVRGELIATILSLREKASGRDFDAHLRALLTQKLEAATTEQLQAFSEAGGLGNIEALGRSPEPHFLGATASDLVFTPVTPCRIVDTRSAAAGIMVAGTQRNFLVRSGSGFATQGGSATDCGIPASATSVEMNFVAVSAVGPGDLRAYPFGGAVPNASVINYSPVPGAPFLNVANGIAQPVCDPATTTCTNDLTIQTDAGNTHLVIDVVGYFKAVTPSQAGFNTGSVVISSTTQTFVASLNSVAMAQGERVKVTAGFGVFGEDTTQGVACGACTTIRGEVAVCYRTAGAGTPTVGNRTFIWDTSANYPGGGVTARKGGMFVQGLFTIPTAGNYDFGICGRRDTTATSDADWRIYYPHVVISRP